MTVKPHVIYIGGGVYHIEGVPSRDLSADEWNEIASELRDKAIQAGTHKLEKVASRPLAAKDGEKE